MNKIIYTILSLIFVASTAYSQPGIDFNHAYSGGRSLQIFVDSAAKIGYYALQFPNQPNTSFSFLPEVKQISFQFNFKKTTNIAPYRYTILVDDKPIEVNKTFNTDKIFTTKRPKDTPFGNDLEEVNSTNIGNFQIKGKVITILAYSIEKPLEIYKSVFYAKPIPKAKMKALGKRFTVEKGVDYNYILNPKEKFKLSLSDRDDEITIVKDRTAIDYLYHVVIKEIESNKIIYQSTAWQYGAHLDEAYELEPNLKFDKHVFKKSGDYEIILMPKIDWMRCLHCTVSQKEIEKFSTKYLISIDLEKERSFTAEELGIYIGITFAIIGTLAGLLMVYLKRKNKNKLLTEQRQKQIAHLHLNSVRSQLNPHFLFNALTGIQNLMNKSETDKANKYLTKYARLTRHVLDSRDLVSIADEKKLLDDYLQMEQLRFGFQYQIVISADLETENIEIPSMLLQPFVENAVKHAISEKENKGYISINFEKQTTNLILQIIDNGEGFQTDKEYKGLGLALSKSRISLLNSIYRDSPIILEIRSDIDGTTVTLTLKEWL